MKIVFPAYNFSTPIADKETGLATQAFLRWLNIISTVGLIIGSGSPEGVVEALQGTPYLDEDGAAGAVFYIKQKSSINNDKSKGWVAIG